MIADIYDYMRAARPDSRFATIRPTWGKMLTSDVRMAMAAVAIRGFFRYFGAKWPSLN